MVYNELKGEKQKIVITKINCQNERFIAEH